MTRISFVLPLIAAPVAAQDCEPVEEADRMAAISGRAAIKLGTEIRSATIKAELAYPEAASLGMITLKVERLKRLQEAVMKDLVKIVEEAGC